MSNSIKLEDLIGVNPDIIKAEKTIIVKGLNVATFHYTSTELKSKGTVIAIHGGPACCHNYILPLQLLVKHGYDVIFYDQAGCGQSSHVTEVETSAPWLLTMEYYLYELEEVISNYELKEYYLYGSSWGTMICQEYGIKQPKGLQGMILDGALCDSDLYITTQWRDRISTLPQYTQNLMKICIENSDFSSTIYEEINDMMSRHFTCRLLPRPECYYDTLKYMDMNIYSKMQGHCEFMVGGILKDWKITHLLYMINCPILVLVGEYDTMTIQCSQEIITYTLYSWPLVIIPRASHMKLLEEPYICIDHIVKFLNTSTIITTSTTT